MAYASTLRSAAEGSSLSRKIAALAVSLKDTIARRAEYSRVVAELSELSDRDLADLGLNSSMIPDIAYEAAYGKRA